MTSSTGTDPVQQHDVPALILASASPRRRELLSSLRIDFRCVPAQVDESIIPGEPPEGMVSRLSLAKAQVVSGQFPGATVIGADTIVVLDGVILGKPTSETEATEMLKSLRGRMHWVLSAISLCRTGMLPVQSVSRSGVWMRDYTDDEIAAYVASGDPLDKAGAYAIQHPGFYPVLRCEGCFASIVGFPLAEVARLLYHGGWSVPIPVATACQGVTGVTCDCTKW